MRGARGRLLLMAPAGLSLLAALWAGLIRLGWPLPPPTSSLVANHGPLMVVAFLGTLIGLERAVALKRRWTYGAPGLAGLAGITLLLGLPIETGQVLAAAGSLFLLAIFVFLYRLERASFFATMGLGALLLFVGNVLWAWGLPLYQVVPWWVGFLVLTIAGERLELSRLLPLSGRIRAGFFLANSVVVMGLLVSLVAFHTGIRLSGLGLSGLALWLLRYDMAWRTLRQGGLSRYMAICLLSGYLWLGVGGLSWLVLGDRFVAGPVYDAMLHSILLGFVFSMVFGHAPLILPAVLGVALPFRRAFYGHWALLHLSLLVRLGGLVPWGAALRWGGLLNALAIVLFLGNTVRAAVGGKDGS